jgi:hypothetical protein
VPELAHWFYTFVVNSAVNAYEIPAPVDIPEVYQPQNSFIELLFNENYEGTSYEYRYIPNPSWGCVPIIAVDRLNIYPGAGQYMKLNEEGQNVFNLQDDDFTMLNALLQYRQDATSVTIIDTTSDTTAAIVASFAFDTTANIYILRVDYNSLRTNLSKLIYLYLDLKIRSNTSRYNNTNLICQTLLEGCYEALVLDEMFKFISARGTQ